MKRLSGLALAGATIALVGCAASPPQPSATSMRSVRGTARPSALLPAVTFVPGSLLLPPPGALLPSPPDSCGAWRVRWLVGQPRSRIPIPIDLNHRRVACTACPVAPDVRLDRLDILWDARTDRVVRVTCG